VFSSPYLRCRETIRPFCEFSGKEPRHENALRERHITPGWVPDFREIWRRSWEDFSFALRLRELFGLRERMLGAMTEIARRAEGKTVAVCGHGSALAIFVNAIAPEFGFEEASACGIRKSSGFSCRRHVPVGSRV